MNKSIRAFLEKVVECYDSNELAYTIVPLAAHMRGRRPEQSSSFLTFTLVGLLDHFSFSRFVTHRKTLG